MAVDDEGSFWFVVENELFVQRSDGLYRQIDLPEAVSTVTGPESLPRRLVTWAGTLTVLGLMTPTTTRQLSVKCGMLRRALVQSSRTPASGQSGGHWR